ncbi:MAG: sulfur carrier protein ThiS adenylyltransferase ThiF [Firmicutes bacterium]|nr:sulfur carrier protein ThiS adenylyltransferase ThiF [Bacillota bacterium]
MKIYLNEEKLEIEKEKTAYELRDEFKEDADIVVLNGMVIKSDIKLKKNDKLTLIKRGEKPEKEELEALMIARHTPRVHEKVKKSTVAIAGLGGLGSNIAISLARLGIKKLLLIDFDVVEPSNLNRQQYFISHIGMYKTEALRDLIAQINPFVDIEIKNIYLDESNIEKNLKDVDIIVEAFDNPKSKATLINTSLTKLSNKPIVAASGVAGYFSNNTIKTKKAMDNLYIVGDNLSEAKIGCGLMAPRVSIAAGHQANTVLRIILGEKKV